MEKYSENFVNIGQKLEKINEILKEYIFEDLLIAIYCVNICVNNRSALESQLALNLGLKTCDRNGTKSIKKYDEFKIFFERIKVFLDINDFDDPILEDFGTVKFRFENNIYDIILGTGYNSVYAQLYFLKPIAIRLSCIDKVNKVLKYNSDIINFFRQDNLNDGKNEIRFVLPSEKLFIAVTKYFQQLDFSMLEDIKSIIELEENFIEKEHFVLYNEKYYPLYNTSILIDLFDKLYNELNHEERIEIAELGVINVLSEISKLDQGKMPYVYFPVNLHDKSKCKIPYTFLLRSSDSTIIGINKDRLKDDDELNNEIKKIIDLAQNNELEIMESIPRNKDGYLGITVTSKCKIKFIIHDSFINICEVRYQLEERRNNNILKCSALDLIYMFLFMEDLDEIDEYINYNEQKDYEQMIGFGGDSSRFLMWKSFNHMFAKGAVQFGLINFGINTSDEYVLDYFEKKINNYPWKNNDVFLFSSPFAWNIKPECNNIYRYSNKINKMFFGYVSYLNNDGACFFAHNISFFNNEDIKKYKKAVDLIDDINLRKINTCKEFLNEIASTGNNFIEILFMPYNYAQKVGLNIDDKREYVYSDCKINSNCINIRYTVNYEKLYEDICNTKNRSVENKYVKELFFPLSRYFPEICSKLDNELENTKLDKKEVDVVKIEIEYIYNDSKKYFNVSTQDFMLAKKEIAKICLKNNVEPGEYYGKDANKIVRCMQKDLISFYEEEISKYNQLDLHYKLLELYSESTHIVNIHQKRYNSFTNVTDDVLNEVQTKIINEREQEKRNSRTILYFIETNLFLERASSKKITDEELNRLLAFSDWLIVLNDNADICHFTDTEAHIKIDYEYVVDNIVDFEVDEDYGKRVYSKNHYTIANDEEDKKYMEQVMNKFKIETGISLLSLFDFCYYLQIHFSEYKKCQISSNVYRINRSETIKNFKKIIDETDGEKYSIEQIEKIIEFFTINTKELKTCKGKTDFYIPINGREQRENRFEVKPILCINDELIFSPVIINNIHNMWFNGILNFMLPYETGLKETVADILNWKKRYENKMVYDIQNIFKENGIVFVKADIYLHKFDKKGGYPLELGDYDIIAIDDIKKNIWIIESKVLNRVGSLFEMISQQKNFFINNKYVEKFQRRIDFMNLNYKKVLKSFGFTDVTGYTVMPYMVFNKVVISRYKKVNFPIISIMELDEIIKSV